jgi:hypothetical protein
MSSSTSACAAAPSANRPSRPVPMNFTIRI